MIRLVTLVSDLAENRAMARDWGVPAILQFSSSKPAGNQNLPLRRFPLDARAGFKINLLRQTFWLLVSNS